MSFVFHLGIKMASDTKCLNALNGDHNPKREFGDVDAKLGRWMMDTKGRTLDERYPSLQRSPVARVTGFSAFEEGAGLVELKETSIDCAIQWEGCVRLLTLEECAMRLDPTTAAGITARTLIGKLRTVRVGRRNLVPEPEFH
jgi:hypothetical protein